MVMGWLWVRFGKAEWIAERALARLQDHSGTNKWAVFAESARHDLVDAGGFLVLGGLFAAAFKTFRAGGRGCRPSAGRSSSACW